MDLYSAIVGGHARWYSATDLHDVVLLPPLLKNSRIDCARAASYTRTRTSAIKLSYRTARTPTAHGAHHTHHARRAHANVCASRQTSFFIYWAVANGEQASRHAGMAAATAMGGHLSVLYPGILYLS